MCITDYPCECTYPRPATYSTVEVTNNGHTAIGEHEIICGINRISQGGGGGIQDIGAGAATVDAPLLPGGDSQTDSCLALFNFKNPAICGDIWVSVTYSLETQPETRRSKVLRFVTTGEGDRITEWVSEPVREAKRYCPPLW
jgi:hypothetical protein